MKLGIKIAFIGIAGLLLLLGWIGETLIVKVPVGQVGVRTQKIALFGEQGVVKSDYGPGWHRNLWFIDDWNLYDSTMQTIHMSRQSGFPFEVKSHDGYSVSLDMTVKYRIREGMAHSVLVRLGPGTRYQGFVANLARDACRSAFGVMKTEAFYQPKSRTEATERAKRNLIESLKKNDADVDVIDILIRDVTFDSQYERKIKDKKLADQDIDLNRSKGLAAQQKGLTQKVEAETEAMVKVVEQQRDSALMKMKAETDQQVVRITADYQKYVTEKRADADLYASQREAAGQLMIKNAEAAGEQMRNRALSGPGGAVMAALEAAKNLTLTDVTFSTLQLDPLDLNGVLKKLGVPASPASTR